MHLFSTSALADYFIRINGVVDLTRSHDSSPTGYAVANGQLVYKLDVGHTVQVIGVQTYDLYGEPGKAYSYFDISLLHAS